jgi:hypothetical protein
VHRCDNEFVVGDFLPSLTERLGMFAAAKNGSVCKKPTRFPMLVDTKFIQKDAGGGFIAHIMIFMRNVAPTKNIVVCVGSDVRAFETHSFHVECTNITSQSSYEIGFHTWARVRAHSWQRKTTLSSGVGNMELWWALMK